jgi:hypothetical protein
MPSVFAALAVGVGIALTLCADPSPGSIRVGEAEQRTEAMAFATCIALTEEMSKEMGVAPANVLRTQDVWLTRIDAADGSVILTCSRPDNRLTLKKVRRPGSPPDRREEKPLPAVRR